MYVYLYAQDMYIHNNVLVVHVYKQLCVHESCIIRGNVWGNWDQNVYIEEYNNYKAEK